MIRLCRSLAFQILYFGWAALAPILFFWAPLPLFPRVVPMTMARIYLRGQAWIEAITIGLDFVEIGTQHKPQSGAYLVALKHQSTWETLKLHRLFGDPAIVYKRELQAIPIWGWFMARAELIPVDRGARSKALKGMIAGAKQIAAQGRPTVIFPQGTRVAAGARKPYRYGIVALYQQLNLPVLPVALNSGVFWPRNGFLKRSGTVTVEYLPLIEPGLPPEVFRARLEEVIETASDRLVQAAGGPALPPPEPSTAKAAAASTA